MADPSTAALVSRYATAVNARYTTQHGVASPLGVWLLLALVAPAAQDTARTELESILGTDVDDAARRARELLETPHPAVAAATAVWADAARLLPPFGDWARTLPTATERGPIPTQAQADQWAHHHTRGMIEHFPADLDPGTLLVLASALATDITWPEPLGTLPADTLAGTFGSQVTTCLVAAPYSPQALVDTKAAGVVAVHAATSASGLSVLNVIAAPDRAPAAVHEAAHQVAEVLAGSTGVGTSDGGEPDARFVDLFDLPLGKGHAWTLTERRERRRVGPGDRTHHRDSEFVTYLPAWSATSTHDLKDEPSLVPVFRTLGSFARAEHRPAAFAARQQAVAEYSQTGFRAAAVTAVEVLATGAPGPVAEVRVRRAEVRFNRRHAVLASTTGTGAWAGVPVFSAWVGEAHDP